ncbi:MAG: type II toxin-antitoxin system HicB family antitoxin [Rhodothermia bacterium]|nr:MAG: type II toxin-antitoxin system HicB family antitoxin [Rhodothermia bacterium]
METTFNVVVERDTEGYLIASVPELPGCHTQAASLDALEERVIEAIMLCMEEQGGRPKNEIQEYYGNLRVTVPA